MEAKDFINELTEIAKLTQSQIAEATGIPQPTISKVARGDVADVLSRNYRKLQALHKETFGAPKRVPKAPAKAACNASRILAPHPDGRPLIDAVSPETVAAGS